MFQGYVSKQICAEYEELYNKAIYSKVLQSLYRLLSVEL